MAIPVKDLAESKEFYSNVLNLKEGRSDTQWQDYDFYGHQLVIHEAKDFPIRLHHNEVDDHAVPVPHFGVVLLWEDFHQLADRLKEKRIKFVIEPYIRFEGKPGEQATMFFYDPSGNALEFKAFKDIGMLFAT